MPTGSGPFERLALGDGGSAPLYLLRYDDDGLAKSPRTTADVLAAAASGGFTDVLALCHGWNNDFEAALSLYRRWAAALAGVLGAHPLGRPFEPLVVGIVWPSTALLMGDEHGPDIAAGPAGAEEAAARIAILDDLASDVDGDDRERFYALADQAELSAAEARELATLVEPLFAGGDDELGVPDGADREASAIVAAARALAAADAAVGRGAGGASPDLQDLDDFGVVGESGGGADIGAPRDVDAGGDSGAGAAGDAVADGEGRVADGGVDVGPAIPGPVLAGDMGGVDVRDMLRVLTVWRMKDRAGRVGARGVGAMLRDLLAQPGAAEVPVHVVGHSFGARVWLSAIAHPPEVDLPRPVASALLLQPAINHLCFAADVLGKGRPGGYRGALARVERPIVSTFSTHDLPLRSAFHLALRRPRDLGEAEIAAGVPGEPPSRYAALGGYGPRGVGAGARTVPIADPGTAYDLAAQGLELLAVDGSRSIRGHGDVAGPGAAWALRALIAPAG